MYNILTERLIRVDKSDGSRVEASLPAVYAALMADEVEAFPAQRPHQRHAWHAFLVQLGAMAMQKAGVTEPSADTAEWANLIRGLTPEFPDDEPWQLVVDDITKPAFMQPPASSEDKLADYKNKSNVKTPDELDIISTSKDHDVKRGILSDGNVNDWILALINLQTMAGQIGNGHYPISRMQSGWNSRTSFTLTSSQRWGEHVTRDIIALLEVDFTDWPMRWDGIRLLWTEPWDGNAAEALTLDKLHPYYLEVCRRRRLAMSEGVIYARVATSNRRLATKNSLGVVGDPWQLVDKRDKKSNKALAMQKDSFNYRRIVDYLFEGDKWDLPPLFFARNSDKLLVARGVKGDRGGETEGYYERIIPFRHRTVQVFGRRGPTKELGDIARERIKQITRVQAILKEAIATFACHGDAKKAKELLSVRKREDALRKRVDEIADKAEEKIDERFFEHLQEEFEAHENERNSIRHDWLHTFLIPSAEFVLSLAHRSLPSRQNEFFYARASSQNLFDGYLKTAFPTLKEEEDDI